MGPIQHVAFLVGSCTLCGCSTAEWRPLPEDSGWTSKDVDCPLISHDPVSSAQTAGRAVPIQAVVSDDLDGDCEIEPDESGVFEVQVFFRTEVATFWTSVPLVRMDGGDAYGGAIPGSAVTSGGMDYYLYASDWRANGCTLPAGGESDPWHFRVTLDP